MRISLTYFAQVRRQAGTETELVTAADGTTALGALQAVEHGAGFRDLLFDSAGALHPVILLVVNGLRAAPDRVLHDGDCVQVFSPMSGG
ncbi:MAG: MoaD/ThiS family protein [bacterium]